VGSYRREACNVTDWNEKMAMGRSLFEGEGLIHRKEALDFETAGSQKEGKTAVNLHMDRFGGSRKMSQNMERG
jgi:hypothetical protein